MQEQRSGRADSSLGDRTRHHGMSEFYGAPDETESLATLERALEPA